MPAWSPQFAPSVRSDDAAELRATRAGGRNHQRGLTLFEVLIVVVLIAVLSGAIIYGSGMLGSSRQRAAATLIISAVRLAVSRANTTGKPVRLVFDLESNQLGMEEASGSSMLRVKEEGESTGAGAEAATEAEAAAREEADRILKGPEAPRARFKSIEQFGFSGEKDGGRELGQGVQFRQVQTEHDGEPRKKGRAYLYFWPGGGTEHASIQIYRGGDDEGLTIVVSALTGRARIQRGRVDLPEPRADGQISEREEP